MTTGLRRYSTLLLLITYSLIGAAAHIPAEDANDDFTSVHRYSAESKASSVSARPIWTKTKHVPVFSVERLPLIHHADEDHSIVLQLHASLPLFNEHPLALLLDRQPCKPRDPPLV